MPCLIINMYESSHIFKVPLSSTFYLSSTPRVRHSVLQPATMGNQTGDRLRFRSHRLLPLPGTPRAAPFGYRSIIVLCICYRHTSGATRIHLYKIDRSLSYVRKVFARLQDRLTDSSPVNTSNVPAEWIFNFQCSVRLLFCPLTY